MHALGHEILYLQGSLLLGDLVKAHEHLPTYPHTQGLGQDGVVPGNGMALWQKGGGACLHILGKVRRVVSLVAVSHGVLF